VEEVKLTKQNLGWPVAPLFDLPPEALAHFREAQPRGRQAESEWREYFARYAIIHPDLAREFEQRMRGELPAGWDADIPVFPADTKGMKTRVASGKVMNAIAPKLPALMGGSADLDPSTYTALAGEGDFESSDRATGDTQGSSGGGWRYAGRNLHFGIREHGMGAILNGMAVYGGMIPYGATFLIFSDYMRPPMRLAAIMEQRVVYVFTHDSIALGEDGTTHQPVEQIANLRAVPRLIVIRPCDANETAYAWRVAIESQDRPVALILTRQDVPTLDRSRYASAAELKRGAYILAEAANGRPEIILIATGSEVGLIVEAQHELEKQNIQTRLVSMPSWELFDAQTEEYRHTVLPTSIRARLAVEAGATQGWHRYVGDLGDVIGLDHFGASAPGPVLLREYGFTVDNVCKRALALLEKKNA
jgi:transketolase